MTTSFRIVTMCTHNRTRSVLMACLLGEHLAARRVGSLIESTGTRGGGQPPTAETVRLLRDRGVDVTDHRSSAIDGDLVERAELIVSAERAHVMHVAGRWPDAFARTWTLPELVQRGEAVGARNGRSLDGWLAAVGEGRASGLDYTTAPDVLEIADPTGRAPAVWKSSFAEIDDLCRRLADLLA
jgi:protein-tyrosine phosphatase